MAEIEPYEEKNEFLEAFKEMRPDFFLPHIYEKTEDIETAAEFLRPTQVRKSMFSSIPMNCKGSSCIFADSCPLQQKRMAPIGESCPIEMALVAEFMYAYMEELQVRPDNLNEVSLIRDLVDQEVQSIRKAKMLAKEDFIQENVVGIDSEGRIVTKKELHLAVDLEDKILKRKSDLRKQLMATREQKAKMGQGNLNESKVISDILDKVREIEIERKKLLEQQLGDYGVDTYIQYHEENIVEAEVISDNG